MKHLSYSLAALGLSPELPADMSTLFKWLDAEALTATGRDYDFEAVTVDPSGTVSGSLPALAQSTNRVPSAPLKQEQLKELKERYKSTPVSFDADQVWEALTRPKQAVRELAWAKLPADAMAFYRPFHVPPFDQWGVYMLVRPLLEYHARLLKESQKLKIFSAETLMHLVLFEVFNHEFFHHLVESAATTLEIVLAATDRADAVYLPHRISQRSNEFQHPHAPLEEALANAYAYNALGFISRVKVGVRTALVKAYQQAVAKHWAIEPAGYRDAAYYRGEDYIAGGAMLLAHLMQKPDSLHQVPLALMAKSVMPSGFAALVAKPDIPTWLVGSESDLKYFHALVPAPNEAYTQLFWPYNTDALDKELDARKKKERELKKRSTTAAGPPSQ